MKSVKKIKKLKTLHIFTALAAVCSMLSAFLLRDIDEFMDIITYIFIFAAIFFSGYTVKNTEPEDELAKQNISKANTIVMWGLILILGAMFMITGRPARSIPNFTYAFVISSAIAMRSLLFLFFDRAPIFSEDEENV